ncbi:serine-repeat antigen 2 [Plasmodium gonderi]|uniref:Putative papain-like cysteine prorease n=1 Tax=Plasmodium gonderi TaxID=77519 RepID=F1SZ29_PLAGO|nr:serine-repeat antigen 2 [Plasmodium gonderi]BAK08487.1 putative papain-like cysteine prorease [Plasmodium gonderi]GAW79528.1 serine-repeat antigen 2 [Plasmodium gonderi]
MKSHLLFLFILGVVFSKYEILGEGTEQRVSSGETASSPSADAGGGGSGGGQAGNSSGAPGSVQGGVQNGASSATQGDRVTTSMTTSPASSQTVVSPPSGNGENPSQRHGSSESVPETNENAIKINSSFLKNHTGVKITGPCSSEFLVVLVPHIYIEVDAIMDIIRLGPKLNDAEGRVEFPVNTNLKNQCGTGKTFKLVLYIYDDKLTLKWKVYDASPGTTTTDNKIDMQTFILRNMDHPITSIQIHNVIEKGNSHVLESKNYNLGNTFPEKCAAYANNCFLSGITDIEKCYKCTLLVKEVEKSDVCYNYILKKENTANEEGISTEGEDEDSNMLQLDASIDSILNQIYNTGNNNAKELMNISELGNSLKVELTNYCNLLKEIDSSGVLDNYEIGNETDVFNNLSKLLKKHTNDNFSTLKDKMKNVAICMKNVKEWVSNKKGLKLPQLKYTKLEDTASHTYDNPKQSTCKNKGTDSKNGEHGAYDIVINLNPAGVGSHQSPSFADSMYCNDIYCDRWKDKNGCLAKIESADQGDCATSWIFASKLHLESIKCMKGYDHVPSSALYVANCSQKEGDAKCLAASNPLEFLNIIDGEKFLPSASDMPYSYKLVGDACPKPKHHWANLWNNIKLLDPANEPNSLSTKGYTSYQSAQFKDKMDEFINLVKAEVMKKGSVIAYVKVDEMMDYDINGKAVHNICGSEVPDLAVNIIGYGNYINAEGVKKSYWIIKNSWGKYWGDEGNFKVDMDTPDQCQHNFIHTAAVFNLDIPQFESGSKKNSELNNYYLNSSPDFYSNLYHNALDTEKVGGSISKKAHSKDTTLYGSSTEDEKVESQKGINGSDDVERSVELSVTLTSEGTQPEAASSSQPSQGDSPTEGVENPEEKDEDDSDGTDSDEASEVELDEHPADEPSKEEEPTANKIQLVHILKHISNGKVKMNLLTYDTENAISGDHFCSRSHSVDPEKHSECVSFCNEKWEECKSEPSPGYCITQKKGNNHCFFCFV